MLAHRILAVSLLAGLAACGGERDARETAEAWVEAINARDWDRACELSLHDGQAGCVDYLSQSGRQGRLRIDAFQERDGQTTFTVALAREKANGWTSYAPSQLPVERHDGEYLVHFEIAVIK